MTIQIPSTPKLKKRLIDDKIYSRHKNKLKFVEGYQNRANSASKYTPNYHKFKLDEDIILGGKKKKCSKPTPKSLASYGNYLCVNQ